MEDYHKNDILPYPLEFLSHDGATTLNGVHTIAYFCIELLRNIHSIHCSLMFQTIPNNHYDDA